MMPGQEPRRGAPVNNVNLIGSLVGDPELSLDRNGRDVCAIQLAVQRRGPAGDPEPGVIYIDVMAYGRQARQCKSELAAGDRIGVAGRPASGRSANPRGPRRSRRAAPARPGDLLGAATPP